MKFESVYLDNLPSSESYELSYMHRDVITHVAVTKKYVEKSLQTNYFCYALSLENYCLNYCVSYHFCRTNFIITASVDGHVKFWKKKEDEGIEFVKHFRSHLGRYCMAVPHYTNHLLCKSCPYFLIECVPGLNVIEPG